MRNPGSFQAGASAAHAPPLAPHPPASRGPVPACGSAKGAVGTSCSRAGRAPRLRRVALAMAMDQVNALCEQLVKAVTVMMDPSSTQRYRLEALKVDGVWRPGPAPRPSPNPGGARAALSPAGFPPTRPLDLLFQPRGALAFPLPALRGSSHSRLSLLAAPALFSGPSDSLLLLISLPLPAALSSPIPTSLQSAPQPDASILLPQAPHPLAFPWCTCPSRPQHQLATFLTVSPALRFLAPS